VDYKIEIYNPESTDKELRFTLGTLGEKTLFIIGLNPSTADDLKPDLTVRKVMRFAENHGFENFVMLNLYAQRTPHPSKLHNELDVKLHLENIKNIAEVLDKHKNPKILAAWGGSIKVRSYFKRCILDIYMTTKHLNIGWLRIGGNDLVAKKHPRHPSRASYDRKLVKFDIENYLVKIK
jgi:hypothetical protein